MHFIINVYLSPCSVTCCYDRLLTVSSCSYLLLSTRGHSWLNHFSATLQIYRQNAVGNISRYLVVLLLLLNSCELSDRESIFEGFSILNCNNRWRPKCNCFGFPEFVFPESHMSIRAGLAHPSLRQCFSGTKWLLYQMNVSAHCLALPCCWAVVFGGRSSSLWDIYISFWWKGLCMC